jgi:predicted AAA+ superfamily ATPase
MSGFTIDEYLCKINEPLYIFDIEDIKKRFKYSKKFGTDELFEFIYRGGLPKTFGFSDEAHKDYLNSYVQTYLMRDVMELGKISDIVKFNRFITACASMISNQLNVATLSMIAGISQPTAKEWLSVLQGLGIIYLLQPYFSNEIKRLVKSPKLYFYDTGLAAYLSLWPSSKTLQFGNMSGAYFENFCMNQITKKLAVSSFQINLFYYRDTGQKEIDLVLESHAGLTPVEIKLSSNPHHGDVTKFEVLKKFNKNILPGAILCTIDKPMLISADNVLVPAALL